MVRVTDPLDHIRESVERLAGFELSLAEKDRAHLLARLDAVTALHKPETRWMPYEGADISFDNPQDAIEAAEDCDLGPCAESPAFFLLCAHCKAIEDAPCEGECTKEAGYRESLWPCPTIKALVGDG